MTDGILALLDAWCRTHLGAPIVEEFFGVQRMSSVHGVLVADGRAVALKVRDAEPRLAACAVVQAHLWRAGLPCPQPLAGPAPLARTHVLVQSDDGAVDATTLAVSAESWEGHGHAAVGPGGAPWWGRLAARIVAAAPRPDELATTLLPVPPWLRWEHDDPRRTWPPPASLRWDPHRVDGQIPRTVHEVARRARARLRRADVTTLPVVVGHGDLDADRKSVV